jgi:hypothetical protein
MTRKAFTHYFLITVLLLSQWITVSAMACPLAASSNPSTTMATMQNSSDMPCHDMAQSSANSNHQHNGSSADCCDNNCHCPSSASFSVLIINTDNESSIKATNLLVEHQPFSSQTTSITQQQKPPQIV